MIHFTKNAKKLYFGSQKIARAYCNSQLVFPSPEAETGTVIISVIFTGSESQNFCIYIYEGSLGGSVAKIISVDAPNGPFDFEIHLAPGIYIPYIQAAYIISDWSDGNIKFTVNAGETGKWYCRCSLNSNASNNDNTFTDGNA